MIIETILTIVAIWIVFAAILPFLILPNFYLRKAKQQNSPYIQKIARQLEANTKQKTLRNVFNFMSANYTGVKDRFKLALYHRLFRYGIERNLKNKNSFLACHQQNLTIHTILKATGMFTNEDIERHWRITKFLTAHQYLIVKADKQKFKVDPFYKEFGVVRKDINHKLEK